jgi:hypothetical protein
MRTETQNHADHPDGSSAPESEPIIMPEGEIATRQEGGLPCPDLSEVGYHECKNKADEFLEELGGSEGRSMPAPERALESRKGEVNEKTADEYREHSVDMTPSDASQLHREQAPQVYPEIDIITRALAIIGSPKQLGRWMNTSLPALQGQTPYSLMNSEGGRKQVEVVLGRIEHGIY